MQSSQNILLAEFRWDRLKSRVQGKAKKFGNLAQEQSDYCACLASVLFFDIFEKIFPTL